MRKLPEDINSAEESYSNFDYVEPEGLDEKMRGGDLMCSHPADRHYGYMWFEDGEFHEEVWSWGRHVDTVSAKSLRELFDAVNEKWGSE